MIENEFELLTKVLEALASYVHLDGSLGGDVVTARVLYHLLARHSEEADAMYEISHKEIAQHLGLDEYAVARSIKGLLHFGFLVTETRVDAGMSRIYGRLVMERIREAILLSKGAVLNDEPATIRPCVCGRPTCDTCGVKYEQEDVESWATHEEWLAEVIHVLRYETHGPYSRGAVQDKMVAETIDIYIADLTENLERVAAYAPRWEALIAEFDGEINSHDISAARSWGGNRIAPEEITAPDIRRYQYHRFEVFRDLTAGEPTVPNPYAAAVRADRAAKRKAAKGV